MAGTRYQVGIENPWGTCDWAAADTATTAKSVSDDWRVGANYRDTLLARTIEGEVIPRLMLAHGLANSHPTSPPQPRILMPEDVVEFARLTLVHETAVAASYVAALRAQGTPLENVFLGLLAPAARYLGKLWEDDLCDFTDVTLALSRMQQILRDLSPIFESEGDPVLSCQRRMLLIPMPGEQHSFGLFMVEEFFRRAGWDVRSDTSASQEELLKIVQGESFDVIGFSVSCDVLRDQLASLIEAIRNVSRNRSISVMVGGRFFIEHPECVAHVGADATAVDGQQAIQRVPALPKVKT